MKRGDVIVGVQGKTIQDADQLVAMLPDSEIGKRLPVEYLRDGKRLSTEVEVADRNRIVADLEVKPENERAEVQAEGTPECCNSM